MNETKKNSEITRKDFLRYVLIAAGVSAIGGGAYIFQRRELIEQPLKVDSLRDQFSDQHESIQLIGQKYLEEYPQGLSESELLRNINEKLSSDHINKIDMSNFAELVRQQILLDFEESKVVNLDGWIITETEAQICALISM